MKINLAAIAATVFAAGTIAVGFVGVAGAAPAVAGSPNCLVSGSTCMRDANDSNSSGNPIVEGSNINGTAENLVVIDGGTQYQFAGHPTLCVGLDSSDTLVVTQPCNGGHGIVMSRVNRNGATAIIDDAATQHFGTEEDITAVNVRGDQLGVAVPGQGFQRWSK